MVQDRMKSAKKRQKGDRVVSYSLGRVTSGKLVFNEVKLIMTYTFYN